VPLYLICQACGTVVGMQPGRNQRCPNDGVGGVPHRLQGPHGDLNVPVFRCCDVCHWVEPWNHTPPGRCPVDSRHGPLRVLTADNRNRMLSEAVRDLTSRAPRYNRQLIVTVRTAAQNPLVPESDGDRVVREASEALESKANGRGLPSVRVSVLCDVNDWSAIQGQLAALDGDSRLYVVGHSDGVRLQGVDGATLSQRLKNAGFRAARRVTLVACRGAQADPDYDGVELARLFHWTLGRYQPRVRTIVGAYRRPIAVVTAQAIVQTETFRDRPWTEGKKLVYDDQNRLFLMDGQRGGLKVLWYWDGNDQASTHGVTDD
jgi:hypothetical protein